MNNSTERFILTMVLWLVRRYLSTKYRLVTPADLEKIVNDYLAELPKLGINLVYQDLTKVGELNEQLNNSDGDAQSDQHPRV